MFSAYCLKSDILVDIAEHVIYVGCPSQVLVEMNPSGVCVDMFCMQTLQ